MAYEDLLGWLKDAWRAGGVAPAQPATPAEIAAFEQRQGIYLPAPFRAYLEAFNGGADGRNGMTADRLVAFWHLDEIEAGLRERSTRSLLPFADFLVDSHEYVVDLDSEAGAVHIDHGTAIVPSAPSFEAFLEGYILDDSRVLHGQDLSSEPAA